MALCFALGTADLLALNLFVFPGMTQASEAPAPSGKAQRGEQGGPTAASEEDLPTATPDPSRVPVVIRFASESAELDADARRVVEALALEIKLNDGMTVRLDGHTDTRGDVGFNQDLSARRAEAVRDRLLASGVERKRIRIRALGSTAPRTREPEAQAENRRVEAYREMGRP